LSFAELGAEETTPWIPPEDLVASELAHLETLVAKTLKRRPAPPAECRVVVGDAFASILDAARTADLIVMATHGRTGLEHLVIGSVAEKVVRHAPIPVSHHAERLLSARAPATTARAQAARRSAEAQATPVSGRNPAIARV
jgi:hypothetical protein